MSRWSLTVLSANSGTGRLRELVEDFQVTEGKVIGRVADIFRGNRDVKMYAIEEKMSATFDQSADVLRQKVYDRDVKTHHVNMRQEAVGVFCFVLVGVVAAGRYMNHHLSAGDVFTYLVAFAVLQGPVLLMFQINVARGRAQASLTRLNDVLATDSSTPEPRRQWSSRPTALLRCGIWSFVTRPISRCSETSIWTSPTASGWRWWGRPVPARARWRRCFASVRSG